MTQSYQAYIDGMDAQAEVEEMRSESATKKISRISELYQKWQAEIAKWEILDHEESIAFDLAEGVGFDKRTFKYKEWERRQSKTKLAGLQCDLARDELLLYIANIA